jgi:hypothetical protein
LGIDTLPSGFNRKQAKSSMGNVSHTATPPSLWSKNIHVLDGSSGGKDREQPGYIYPKLYMLSLAFRETDNSLWIPCLHQQRASRWDARERSEHAMLRAESFSWLI